jgi:PKHD-type hydroxylase|tara:strand:- start:119 stop:742 length:624 start_codon:yes stop_codon:yes gene_type:complete
VKKIKQQKKIKFENPCWNFKLDHIQPYAFWENAFTKIECESIIKIAKKKGLTQGKSGATLQDSINNKDSRQSKICWLYASDDMDWVFRKVTDIVLSLNKQFFQFNLFGLSEGFQFTNYVAPSDKFKKHIDRNINFPVRKLSMSIQLTDPKKYEGGELVLYNNEKGDIVNKEQGTLILFPSFILHEVTPITKGERNSLVSWVTGDNFK